MVEAKPDDRTDDARGQTGHPASGAAGTAPGPGIRLPDHLADLFEDLSDDNNALQAKHNMLRAFIDAEQNKLAIRAKELWAETIALLNLKGEWRYRDGFVHPIDPPVQK